MVQTILVNNLVAGLYLGKETGNENSDFPGGTSFLDGITRHLSISADGQVILADAEGNYSGKPDAAIVVFGEEPYAEFRGDRDNLSLQAG